MSTKAARSVKPLLRSGSGSQLAAGQAIGNYRIVREVGVGGMAQVFLASREGPEGFAKPYVIKLILPELSRDEQFAQMFIIEAKVAAMLDHPNIVHVFDFEIEDGNYYLVMEYVSGASLAEILRANRRSGQTLGPQLAVELGAAVAQALAYAHQLTLPDGKPLELVHRDISPGNLLVSRDGAVKLADFGVVKTSMTASVTGVVNGKWAYMSPEQITGQSVDQRSDLFSLGIVLYEVITGVRLFRGESAAVTASRVLEAEIPRPKSVVRDLDPSLDALVMRLLERDPRARYQTASALAADLETLRATPAFAGGAARLRSLVKALFPEEVSIPALGTSLNEASASTTLRAGAGAAPRAAEISARRAVAPDRAKAERVSFPRRAAQPETSWKLLLGIAAACIIGSFLFWFLVF